MANQKEIRTKIDSVKKTKKITSAMKLVAAAKVRKVQKQVLAGRPFSKQLKQTISNLKEAIKLDIEPQKYPLLANHGTENKVLLVVISSDRGLCGGYNANVIKSTIRRLDELKAEGKEVELVTVGRKATSFFSKRDLVINKSFTNLPSIPTVDEAQLIAEYISNKFTSKEFDKVEMINTKFISLVNSEVLNNIFLPINIDQATEEGEEHKASPYTIFDPDIDSLINAALPMYVENSIYQALLEATASELAARMTAMSNATTNAENFINKLVLSYNKARQAAITQEISEIVGGAAALG